MPFGRNAKGKDPLNEAGLYDYAVKALGRQMRAEAELRRLMAARAEPGASGEAVVRTVIARLKDHGYLNDKSFAETYARLRQENEKLGARRVRNDLRQKKPSPRATARPARRPWRASTSIASGSKNPRTKKKSRASCGA